MTTTIQTESGQQNAPEWQTVPFAATVEQIQKGFVECPELKAYYFKLYENEAKAFEYQFLTSH